jgi:hypothetical protein
MKQYFYHLFTVFTTGLLLSACVSVPKESIALSQTIDRDLSVYKTSHIGITERYFDMVEEDINRFIDSKITPALINEMIKMDIAYSDNNTQSLFYILSQVRHEPSPANTSEAVRAVTDFQSAINKEIQSLRNELLLPVKAQRDSVLKQLSDSYETTIDASKVLTSYLTSAHKVKESRDAVLSYSGLGGCNDSVISTLASLSNKIDQLAKKTNDLSSSQLINALTSVINNFTNK